MRATQAKLLAHKNATERAVADADAYATAYKPNEETQQLLDAVRDGTLVYPSDFHDRKLKITELATSAYICSIATLPEYRGKGLASGLLLLAFREASKSPSLESVVLGTDTVNTSAVRAYTRAGMVETKQGFTVTKQIASIGP